MALQTCHKLCIGCVTSEKLSLSLHQTHSSFPLSILLIKYLELNIWFFKHTTYSCLKFISLQKGVKAAQQFCNMYFLSSSVMYMIRFSSYLSLFMGIWLVFAYYLDDNPLIVETLLFSATSVLFFLLFCEYGMKKDILSSAVLCSGIFENLHLKNLSSVFVSTYWLICIFTSYHLFGEPTLERCILLLYIYHGTLYWESKLVSNCDNCF